MNLVVATGGVVPSEPAGEDDLQRFVQDEAAEITDYPVTAAPLGQMTYKQAERAYYEDE